MVAEEILKPHFFRTSKPATLSKMTCLPVRASLLQMRIQMSKAAAADKNVYTPDVLVAKGLAGAG